MRILSNIILAKINKIIFCRILSERYNLHLSITGILHCCINVHEWKGLKMIKSHYGRIFLFYFIILWVQGTYISFQASLITCTDHPSKKCLFSKIFDICLSLYRNIHKSDAKFNAKMAPPIFFYYTIWYRNYS